MDGKNADLGLFGLLAGVGQVVDRIVGTGNPNRFSVVGQGNSVGPDDLRLIKYGGIRINDQSRQLHGPTIYDFRTSFHSVVN